MALEAYIEELLYRYDCVVVPEFGAFLTERVSAKINTANNTFYPPTKTLSFNQLLTKNDGLLASHMAAAEKLPYSECLRNISEQVSQWKHRLDLVKKLHLHQIGEIALNTEGKMTFQPDSGTNYLPTSFGLAPFVASPVQREVLKEEVIALEEKIPFMFTPEQRERKTPTRPYLQYAAVILLALATGFTGFQLFNQTVMQPQVVEQQVQQEVFKNIQEATFFSTRPMELPALTLDATKTNGSSAAQGAENTHNIIAGAFRVKANAEKKVEELRSKGYNAFYLGENSHGLHQVCFDSFSDAQEALDFLKKVRQSEAPEAWMLSIH